MTNLKVIIELEASDVLHRGVETMQIIIDPAALQWFKREVGTGAGDEIKFYARYGGSSPVQDGFSLGFTAGETPINMAVRKEVDGMLFYIEESDLWYFDGHDLHVVYNEGLDEIEYKYVKNA